ncbi:MAG: twin-arginine translocase subunit TatC [Sedimentisphaerales bacterium]|nr:twin-arginine translocase subunit TatC [Sedimentisphaerales bacterium]
MAETREKEDDLLADTRMSFGEHLDELRSRLFKCIYGILIGIGVCLCFGGDIFAFLSQPLIMALKAANLEEALYASTLPEPFVTYLKVSMFSGLFLVSPWVIYQLWGFVGAGLYPKEKRFVHIFMPFSAVLFLVGASFFMLVVAPISCNFFVRFGMGISVPAVSEDSFIYRMLAKIAASEGDTVGTAGSDDGALFSIKLGSEVPPEKIKLTVDGAEGNFEIDDMYLRVPRKYLGKQVVVSYPDGAGGTKEVEFLLANAAEGGKKSLIKPWFTLQKYVNLVLVLSLAFGVAFQVPLVVFFLGRLRLVEIRSLRSMRKYVFIVFLILSAMMTPPDVISQIALCLPMYVLYELGILMLRFWPGPDLNLD